MHKSYLLYGLLLTIFCPIALQAGNYVIINQVMYDSPRNELVVHPPYSNGEFVELYNGSNEAVSLHNWYLYGESETEHFLFQNISIPAKGYLVVAFRHEDSPLFTLDSLYTLPAGNPNFQIIYQNSVILANAGETIQLRNADWQMMDQITYDGNSHLSKPDRLSADNPDSIPGNQCVSLHRTWVEFAPDGLVVPGTSQWKTSQVSFGACQLADSTFGEHYITGAQSLPAEENYILSVTPLDPTTRVSVTGSGISVSNGVRTMTNIQYYDGLGRPNEQIAVDATPGRCDLVYTTNYSGLHRATQQWLPVTRQTNGGYVDVATVQSQNADDRPFTELIYENSALDRLTAQKQPGASYSSHPATNLYSVNAASDNVRIYTVTNEGDLKTTGSNYASGALYKVSMADEDGKSVTTYTDKLGRTVAEERGGNKTYYVYDNFGRLRFVLPHISPSKLSDGTYELRNATLRAAAYCYKYDSRGNMIYKRLPGCAPQYMVYDKTGQLILRQDGNQRRAHKWTMFAYDSIGRNLYTAELSSTSSHSLYMTYFADIWYVEHYGNNPSNTSIPGTGYASSVFPKSDLQLLTINYYDDYDYLKRLATPHRQAIRFAQESGYGLQHDNATGLLTGTRVYNLSEEGYTAAAYYYDTKGRIVQSRSIRSTDGYKTAFSTEYMFDGTVAQQLSVQGTDSNLVREHYRYNYDHVGRTKKIFYQLNDNEEIALSELSYDNMGRLVQNLLHNQKDAITYTYDIRNMLTEMHNRHYSEQLFYADQSLLADFAPHAQACYNGNIAATQMTQEDSTYTFAYTYDAMNRLTESVEERNGAARPLEWFNYDARGNILQLQRYSGIRLMDDLAMTYQQDGNRLLAVQDDGLDGNLYGMIEYEDRHYEPDSADMRYDDNGNLIYDADRGISVISYNILNLPDTIQFANGNQIVNLYDAAGQKYKSIVYTNLATTATPYYDIAQYSFEADTIWYNVTEYAGNLENRYSRTDTTRRIFNTTGYYADGAYYHYIKDHVGNINAVVNSVADTLVQSTIYYASGVPMVESKGIPYQYYNSYGVQPNQNFGRDEQPYLYNGKEFNEAHGLNEYDSQARYYYSPIGRTTTMDPLAENYYHISPYAWCGNNPVAFVDPDGMVSIFITGQLMEDVVCYNPYEKYNGDDSFILNTWSLLDDINQTETGSTFIKDLIDADGMDIYITNDIAKSPSGVDVKGYKVGKGELLMGGENVEPEALAHELFHAYQDVYGYGGASCANDVEAYLFQGIIGSERHNSPLDLSLPYHLMPVANSSYANAFYDIYYGILNSYNLNILAKGFKSYSNAGITGVADKYTTFSPNQQYRVLNFWKR